MLHSIHALAQFRKDLLDMLGPVHTRRLFTRFGYFWGNADAAAMKRIFTWDSLTEWLRAGPRMLTLQGVTRVMVKSLILEEQKGRLVMHVIWHDSGEAEEHLHELGPAAEPACWMLAGYASGYATFCLDRPIYFVEEKCCARGDRTCAATGKDAASWGEALKPFLPYFQADDIQGKVVALSAGSAPEDTRTGPATPATRPARTSQGPVRGGQR